ncbi:MAG: NADH-quinone oxidoreductase subunit C [Chloroflexi bacterium]|nr:NADH-quinone oxidoreductase subunit C [Chloroflexota bacterium]
MSLPGVALGEPGRRATPTLAELVAAVAGATLTAGDTPAQDRIVVPVRHLADACAAVNEGLNAPLAMMVGLDDRARSGAFRLVYVFSAGDRWVSVEAAVDPGCSEFPSVTPRLPAAHWYEREVQDLLGLAPIGHPDPRRLVLHESWPAGSYPLRKDFDPAAASPVQSPEPPRFHHLHGEGIVEIPVGPIHAGVIEPGHFRFAAVGEVVLHLEARLFFTHRGVEKTAEGRSVRHGLQIAERACGVCACSHAVSYCQAVESIAGAAIPARATALRTIFLELERLYNHVGDLGNMCSGVGFAVGTSQGARLKEDLQRLNERLSGHRFLRGICTLGGVTRDVDAEACRDLLATLERVEDGTRRFVDLLLSTEPVLERLAGTGVVPSATARLFGTVGVAARASGIDRDARRDRPYAGYGGLHVPVSLHEGGDVLARLRVRIDETFASFRLIQALVEELSDGPLAVALPSLPAYRVGIGVTESPRGENVHWLRTGPNGTIDRYRIRSASFANWPIVTMAVPGNMVPDFPLINKSFELCYACLDR